MINEVSQKVNNIKPITFEYFENGHTYRTANTFHQVEEEIKMRNYLYNFDDLVDAVKERGNIK